MVNKDRAKNSQQNGNESCSVVTMNSGVKSVDNQYVVR